MAEVELVLSQGYREIKFIDDTLAADYNRAMTIAREIKKRLWNTTKKRWSWLRRSRYTEKIWLISTISNFRLLIKIIAQNAERKRGLTTWPMRGNAQD